jgi:hypothetical protein
MKSSPKPPSSIRTPTQNDISSEQEQRIRLRAYEIFQQHGRQDGHDLDDWLQAEAELTQQQPKTAAA